MENIVLKDVTLKMCEKTMMSESIREEKDGKTSYVKTGKKIEQTTYTFVDENLNKLVFLSDNMSLRKYEGQTGELYLSLVHDNFNGINKIQFKGFIDRN